MKHKRFSKKLLQNFTLSSQLWANDRKAVKTGRKFEHNIGSATIINAALDLIAAHQKTEHKNPDSPAIILSYNRFNNEIYEHESVKNTSRKSMILDNRMMLIKKVY